MAVRAGYLDSPVVTCTLTAYGRLFTDVDAQQWYYAYVGEAVRQGLMSGTGAYTFSPDTVMTRAMLAAVLYGMAGQPAAAAGSTGFADVPDGAWYADAVRWAVQAGIVTGMGDGRFAPDDPVTREQLAVFLYRYAQQAGQDTTVSGAPLAAFLRTRRASAPMRQKPCSGRWPAACSPARTARPCPPQGSATRAQAAAILVRFAQLDG